MSDDQAQMNQKETKINVEPIESGNMNESSHAVEKEINQDSGSPKSEDSSHPQKEGSEVAALNEEIERLQSESKENFDKYMRAAADMENIRRRCEKEKSDIRQFSMEGVFSDLLPVLDSFNKVSTNTERANLDTKTDQSFFEGIELVKKQLLETLEKYGLSPVESKDSPFDPNVHQAIQKIESKDASKELVKDEFSKGYTLNGRLIRPAMVSVLVPTEP